MNKAKEHDSMKRDNRIIDCLTWENLSLFHIRRVRYADKSFPCFGDYYFLKPLTC